MKLYWVGSELVPYRIKIKGSLIKAGNYVSEQYKNGLDRDKVGFFAEEDGKIYFYAKDVTPGVKVTGPEKFWMPAPIDPP